MDDLRRFDSKDAAERYARDRGFAVMVHASSCGGYILVWWDDRAKCMAGLSESDGAILLIDW